MSVHTQKLRITEIFYSLQGESKTVGLPTIFIRLTGCPLRCRYCDTEYAFQGGEWWSLSKIINEIKKYNTPYITLTGGEPLAQKASLVLLRQLSDLGYKVSLETSGALDIQAVDPRVMKVMDLKTPSSNEESKNNYSNLDFITVYDQIKFVICNREDYDWAVSILGKYKLTEKCEVLFSPVNLDDSARMVKDLANWILTDQLSVRFQIQLHKTIWGNVQGV
ncbi:7-carboxy-7-deazaguanine synthase [hydrothermal vent metagenome]|uniref:7-carboxy-7-deazaguanine synthase n=1 Tax=hydrothermal vent metagenome TaxID=652676 RepID=A0A3B0ZQW9_9ZZZZ